VASVGSRIPLIKAISAISDSGTTPLAGASGRRRWYILEERQTALFRGRVIAIVAVAATALVAPLDMSARERALAVVACAIAIALHALLQWASARWPRRLLAAVDAGLVLDALLVLALALLSGGAHSPALWLLPPMALAATLGLSASSGLKAAVLSALVVGGTIAIDGDAEPASDWLGPLILTAIVVVVAGGLSAVNERELRRRGERMSALHAASVAFARAESAEEIETIAQGTAAALLPEWDVTVRRDDSTGQERTWREGGRVVLEVPIAPPGPAGESGRPLGTITAARDAPRLGPPRVRGQQLLALRTLAGAVAAALGQQELLQRLERQSMADALTGLGNRRAFDEALEVELKRARRAGGWVGLVMMDVDHFKRFNDQHGHQAGDDALVTVGRVLTRVARAEDRACRIGGEEFALLLPGADEHAAAIVAERVRRDVQHRAPAAGPVTISLGVAASRGDDGQALLASADARLYAAKETGRNRVVGAPAPSAPG
jgi:diguanylate cyclase (GGDEF)-like protein